MSTNKTPNLNLHSWVETDPVLMREFNENFNALDAAAKNLSGKIEEQAAQSAAYGNCRIVTGCYIGTGEWGVGSPSRLYFDFVPKWVIITSHLPSQNEVCELTALGSAQFDISAIKGAINRNSAGKTYAVVSHPAASDADLYVILEEEGKTLCWYAQYETYYYPTYQLNGNGYVYYYTAIG